MGFELTNGLTAADVEAILVQFSACDSVEPECAIRLARALQAAWRERDEALAAMPAEHADMVLRTAIAENRAERAEAETTRLDNSWRYAAIAYEKERDALVDERARAEAERDQARRELVEVKAELAGAYEADNDTVEDALAVRDAAQRECLVLRDALQRYGDHDSAPDWPQDQTSGCAKNRAWADDRNPATVACDCGLDAALSTTQPAAIAYTERMVREAVAPWRQVVESIEAELLLTADPWAHRGRALRLASDALRASSRSLPAPASETKR